MIDIGILAETWGYPVVVLGTALQGDTALLVCGFLAHQGHLNVWLVWLTGSLSATAGDVIYFWLGWRYGDKVLRWLPGIARSPLVWAKNMVDKHPSRTMIFMRYFFGVRMAMPVLCGMSAIRFGRFLRYNLITALVWAGIFVWIGYVFGLAAKGFVGQVEKFEIIFTLVLAVVGILYGILGKRVSMKHISSGRVGDSAADDEPPDKGPSPKEH